MNGSEVRRAPPARPELPAESAMEAARRTRLVEAGWADPLGPGLADGLDRVPAVRLAHPWWRDGAAVIVQSLYRHMARFEESAAFPKLFGRDAGPGVRGRVAVGHGVSLSGRVPHRPRGSSSTAVSQGET